MSKGLCIAVILLLPSLVLAQAVTADFGDHLSTANPISPGILGAQYSNPMSSGPINSTYNGGFRTLRMYAWLQVVYATRTANWSKLDQYLGAIQSANVGKNPGFRVILELTYTPPWLVPSVQGCPALPGREYQMPPQDVPTWAKLAQSIVAHVDQKFPDLVTDYEIWNEPELATFCVNPNTATNRLSRYLDIYATTAPLIRSQLQKDGKAARIGGPAIVSTGSISQWIGGLVNNTSTANYVDFVSYHKYPAGQSEIDPGCMQWNSFAVWNSSTSTCVASTSGVQPLYSRVQSTSALGFMSNYLSVASVVKAGKQQNPTQTKIYLDEYNDDWYFYLAPPKPQDCCRNSPTYSPLFNGLVMVDLLNSIYNGAHRVPDSLEYYSLSNQPFCLVGDSGGRCGTGNFNTLYPQYYLYSLFGSPNYLNLSGGGNYMAKSISPGFTASGLTATAFWSANQDNIVVVNPTGTNYSSVAITASNPGFAIGNVTEFLLNNTNRTISSFKLSASSTVNVNIPAYSVVALKITPGSAPEFAIATSPASQTVAPGSGTTYSTSVTATNGFSGTVDFSVGGLPAGATASFSPTSVNGSGSSTLTVNTDASTPTGTFPLTITGTSGTLQHSTQATLNVSSAGGGGADFSLSASPASRTISQNSWSTYSVSISPLAGFSGVVTFSASGLPAGATAKFAPTSVTGSGSTSMTISCAGWTVPGNYTVTITATSGSTQHTTTVGLSVIGFSLSVSPTSQSVTRGSAVAYTATVTDLNGYSATATMSVIGLPSGATATFNPNSIVGSGTSTMRVQTNATTPTGNYNLTVKATSSVGSLYHTSIVTLSVR